jgi:hypothetical protein
VTYEHEDGDQDENQDKGERDDQRSGLHFACGAAGSLFLSVAGLHGAIVPYFFTGGSQAGVRLV